MRRNKRFLILSLLVLSAVIVRADVTPAKKKKKPSLLQSLSKTLDTGSSQKSPTTVAGVRGLDEPGGPVDMSARDFDAIDRLEKVQITDDELKAFVKEGGLK